MNRVRLLFAALAALLLFPACTDDPNASGGFGADPNWRSEYFTQQWPSRSDILWVIDSSCSMEDEQASLVENFPSFIEFFVTRDLAFHLAVTTTNIDDPNSEGLDGEFNGSPGWINQNVDSIEEEFLSRALVGIDDGHGKEKGLEAAYRALTEPAPGDEGFVRDDAHLAVIVVSDEPDHTARPEEEDHDQWIGWVEFSEWLEGLKGPTGQRMVNFNAITGVSPDGFDNPGGCGEGNGAGGGALRGSGYLEAADATGGTWMSICEPDWGDMLGRVGLSAAGLMDSFRLEEVPDLDTLEVRIDGRQAAGWEYRDWDNAIVFTTVESVPLPGEETSVRYRLPTEIATE